MPLLTCLGRQERAAGRLQPLGALDVRFATHKSRKQQPNFFRVFGSQMLLEVWGALGYAYERPAVSFPKVEYQKQAPPIRKAVTSSGARASCATQNDPLGRLSATGRQPVTLRRLPKQ